MKYKKTNEQLVFNFSGELDNYAIMKCKEECIETIQKTMPKKVVLDFLEVSFVDSTGIGFVLARYKQCQKINCELVVANLSKNNRALFAMSGIFRLIKEERNEVNL